LVWEILFYLVGYGLIFIGHLGRLERKILFSLKKLKTTNQKLKTFPYLCRP